MKNNNFHCLLLILTLTCLIDLNCGAVIRSGVAAVQGQHMRGSNNRRPLEPFLRRQNKNSRRGGKFELTNTHDSSTSGSESEEEGFESMRRRQENHNNSPSIYATQLFDLLGQADMDNNGEINREEYAVWNTAQKFPENDAKIQFDDMDKNKDSLLSYGEYYTWVNKFWTNSRPYVRQTFRDADADMNGKVSRDEYIKWHHSFENTKAADTELEFLNADTNQDGLITVADFEMITFMEAADKNLDGKLTIDEYLRETLKYLPSFLTPALQKKKDEIHFYDMDSNFDGFLSLNELEDEME